MKSLWNKINQLYEANTQHQTDKTNQAIEKEAPLMSALGIIFGPYNLFIDNTRKSLLVSSIFALLLTIVFVLMGQNTMCLFKREFLSDVCSESLSLYITSRIIGLCLITMFCVRFYNYCYQQKTLSWRWLLTPQLLDIKALLAILIIIALNMLSVLAAYLLYIREPTPYWQLEFAYFVVVSIGFIVPFVLLRFYSLFALILGNRRFPPLKELWQNTAGNGLRLLFSFSLLFCIFVFSVNSVINNFRVIVSENTFFIAFIAEYVFNLVILLNIMFFINFCQWQKQFLFGEKEHD